jgi:pimeloyl-ACP methyl ester carboxylesterase
MLQIAGHTALVLSSFIAVPSGETVLSNPPRSANPLPAPSGTYGVGTDVLEPVVDRSRPDSRFARGARTLAVQLWYPTEKRTGALALYFPDPLLLDAIKAESSAPDVAESWRTLATHAIERAPVALGKFPLVLFSPGFGMPRAYYTSWVEELASGGLIVAVVDHPFAGHTRLDGRVITATPHPNGPFGQTGDMAADLRFLLPLLVEGPGVDPGRIAALGHSIGGAAALEACRLEPRISACVNIDGDPSFGRFSEVGVGRPFLVIHQKPVYPGATADSELAKSGRQIEGAWQSVIARQAQPVLRLSVRGTGHLSFTDAPFIRPSLVTEGGGVLTDPVLVLRATAGVIRSYLRNVFAGQPGGPIEKPEFIEPARLGSLD